VFSNKEAIFLKLSIMMLNDNRTMEKILDRVPTMGLQESSLLSCAGQVTATDIYSDVDLPQTAIAAPDGYAVKSADIQGAAKERPVSLRVIATARAGHPSNHAVKTGTAIRIMTGSVLPKGADCVVKFEDTDEPAGKNGPNLDDPKVVKIYLSLSAGDNVRPSGSKTRQGMLILPKGTPIGPAQVSILASLGKKTIEVIRRPVVAIIATGDELIPLGKPLALGKIYNCNTVAIASLVTYYGGIPKILGIARDNESSLTEKMIKGLTADAIITSGGVSMGDYDLVRLVLGKIGEMVLSRTKMDRKGTVSFGMMKRYSPNGEETSVPVFLLPGSPKGCLLNFETLVRPALLKMLGFTPLTHPPAGTTGRDSNPWMIPEDI
jgi:molybdopterin molybdotransferase